MLEKWSLRRERHEDAWADHSEYGIFTSTERQPDVFSNNYLNQKTEQFDPMNAKIISLAIYNHPMA